MLHRKLFMHKLKHYNFQLISWLLVSSLIDPCDRLVCNVTNTICEVVFETGKPFCTCAPGFMGDPNYKCGMFLCKEVVNSTQYYQYQNIVLLTIWLRSRISFCSQPIITFSMFLYIDVVFCNRMHVSHLMSTGLIVRVLFVNVFLQISECNF